MIVAASILRVLFGFVAAVLVAGLVQVLFVAGDELATGVSGERLQSLAMLLLLAATQSAVFAAPFAFLAAAVAAQRPPRSAVFFLAVGLAIGLAGFTAQYVAEGGPRTILNAYALAAYATSGLSGGFAYWIAAVPKRIAARTKVQ